MVSIRQGRESLPVSTRTDRVTASQASRQRPDKLHCLPFKLRFKSNKHRSEAMHPPEYIANPAGSSLRRGFGLGIYMGSQPTNASPRALAGEGPGGEHC
jgi:hypothetical protein